MSKTDFAKTLKTARELELTVTGRVSGKKISLPVWFTYDSNVVLLLPLKGTRTNWYKNVVKTPNLSLGLKGTSISLKAKPSTDKSDVEKTIESFRAKYGVGDVKKYYSKFDACVKLSLLYVDAAGPGGMAPSCLISPRLSSSIHSSTALPSLNRIMLIPETEILLPVGRSPMSSPL